MKKVIFATTNKNKVREVNMMMKDFDVELQTMGEALILWKMEQPLKKMPLLRQKP